VNGDTLFEIGSITKTFTALLLQDRVERGEMSLDDPVAKYLPNSVTMPTRGGKQITLLQLATHTSGLPRDPDNLKPRNWANGYADYTVEQLYAFLSNHTLVRDPGAGYEYSNLGAGLLGYVLAHTAGTSYESLVLDRICGPLEMESTRIALTPALKTRVATGHDWYGKPAATQVIQTIVGTGGIHSTANDMLKYLSAQLGLTDSNLTPSMEKTHETRLKIAGPGGADSQALGWSSGGDLVWHAGGTSGFAAFAGFNKKQRRAVVVLSNSSAGRGVYAMVNLLLVGDWDTNKRPITTPVDPRIYDSYAGQYQLTGNPPIGVRREGDRLLAHVTGQLPVELLPESATRFFVRVNGRSVAFVPDERGRVRRLTSTLKGIEATFAKVSDVPPVRERPPKPPVFVEADGRSLDAFVGRYKLAAGPVISLIREDAHLIMLPERRGGLELYPESETKLSCPHFHFEVTLLRNDQGETTGVALACPEPDYSGNALKITSAAHGPAQGGNELMIGLLAALGVVLLLVARARRRSKTVHG